MPILVTEATSRITVDTEEYPAIYQGIVELDLPKDDIELPMPMLKHITI